jgi:hypothetical protein
VSAGAPPVPAPPAPVSAAPAEAAQAEPESRPASAQKAEVPAEKNKTSAAGESAPPAPAAETPVPHLVPAESIKNTSVSITRPRDEHDLLTVGDFVFLPPPGFKTLTLNEKYFIYRILDKAYLEKNPGQWCERIGKLEIWEINPQLVTGRIIAASDIIHKGDLICLQEPH